MADTKSLVIVESPAKARTIAGYLGDGFVVESSVGHIRDLPKRAGDVPAAHKKKPWARLGVDVDNGFRPLYVVDPGKKPIIQKLKARLAEADCLYLATDEDREGESIAWHLLQVLKPTVPVKRMVFHEITRRAIEQAIKRPRELDRRLVDAQEARRILDRLYGYEVSPVLWKKVMPRLSAGRVQSVATRIIVERERERLSFTAAGYWDVEGVFATDHGTKAEFNATLVSVDDVRVASGKDFGPDGKLQKPDLAVLDEHRAAELVDTLGRASFSVQAVERKPHKKSPSAPFMTSTLQQEAGRKLKFSAARAMRAAQTLYESGYITYMRTDSTTLSAAALRSAREQIQELYGDAYLPEKPRAYRKKVKNAQEAHEAIRPAGEVFRMPERVTREVGRDEARLYELIWKRTIASQMSDARGESVQVRIVATAQDGTQSEFSATGNTIVFPGFLRAYVEGSDDPGAELETRDRHLPPVRAGESLVGKAFKPLGHQTQPPARFTEASLVRRLEELGVGRPSTYASIISTILDRGYVWRKGPALVPSLTAFVVVALLEQHFTDLVDYAFTARMEDELDAIARGAEELVPWLTRFYFGAEADTRQPQEIRPNGMPLGKGLRSLVAARLSEIDARAINSLPIGTDSAGREVVARVGKYGAYLQRGDDTARLPDDIPPDELTLDRALELLEAPNGDRELGVDPATGLPVFVRAGRFGAYVQLGKAGTGKDKPRTSSILSSMSPETLTLQDALRLLALPRQVGVDPASGEPITAQLGRYGPYVAQGSESRTLASEEDAFTITLEQALGLFAQPRQRRARPASAPLAEFGEDPASKKPITLREGRFGFYVTDGEVNASLRRGETPDTLTAERARELLRLRRERGPAKRSRKTSKSTPRKPSSGKKTAKKSVARKTSAKKPTARKVTAKKKPANQKAPSKKVAGKATGGATGAASRQRTSKSAGKTADSIKRTNRPSGASLDG